MDIDESEAAELGGRRLPLFRRGKVVGETMVDEEDYGYLNAWRWHLHSSRSAQRAKHYAVRYERTATGKIAILMHRAIIGLPSPGDDLECDHLNGDGLDNRKCNLRAVSHAHNQQNKRGNLHGTSQYRGVHWESSHEKWRAVGRLHGKQYHLGYFISEEQARDCARAWRSEHMPYALDIEPTE